MKKSFELDEALLGRPNVFPSSRFSYRDNDRYGHHRIKCQTKKEKLERELEETEDSERRDNLSRRLERANERYSWAINALVEANFGLLHSKKVWENPRIIYSPLEGEGIISIGHRIIINCARSWNPNEDSGFAHYFISSFIKKVSEESGDEIKRRNSRKWLKAGELKPESLLVNDELGGLEFLETNAKARELISYAIERLDPDQARVLLIKHGLGSGRLTSSKHNDRYGDVTDSHSRGACRRYRWALSALENDPAIGEARELLLP